MSLARLAALLALGLTAAAQSTITCGDSSLGELATPGFLMLFPSASGSSGSSLPAAGSNISVHEGGALFLNGSEGAGYVFQSCNSAFMGYPTQVEEGPGAVAYGLLLAPGGEALTVNYTDGAGPYYVRSAVPSLADDASQLLQYWSLTNTSDGLALGFRGVTTNNVTGTGPPDLTFWLFIPSGNTVDGKPLLVDTFLPQDAPAPADALRLLLSL